MSFFLFWFILLFIGAWLRTSTSSSTPRNHQLSLRHPGLEAMVATPAGQRDHHPGAGVSSQPGHDFTGHEEGSLEEGATLTPKSHGIPRYGAVVFGTLWRVVKKAKRFSPPLGIAILIVCIPGSFWAFITNYGLHDLLVPAHALPFLMLPLFLIGVALVLPIAAKTPKGTRRFAMVYGLFWLAWCVTMVLTNAPWASQVIGK